MGTMRHRKKLLRAALIVGIVTFIVIGSQPALAWHEPGLDGPPEKYEPEYYHGGDFNVHVWTYGTENISAQRKPGATEVSMAYKAYANVEGYDLEPFTFFGGYAPWEESLVECGLDNFDGAGIDRNNTYPDESTKSDEGVTGNIEEVNVNGEHFGYTRLNNGSTFGTHPVNLYSEDAFVLAIGDCWVNPQEPGWYRMTWFFNGTGPDGEEMLRKIGSEWFWICECENREQAVAELGEPGTANESWWKDTTGPDEHQSPQTITPTPTVTLTPAPTSDRTLTATSTRMDDSGNTVTEAEAGPGSPSPTGTLESGADEDDTTPTAGSGPGFGPIGAIVVLFSIALASRRLTSSDD